MDKRKSLTDLNEARLAHQTRNQQMKINLL